MVKGGYSIERAPMEVFMKCKEYSQLGRSSVTEAHDFWLDDKQEILLKLASNGSSRTPFGDLGKSNNADNVVNVKGVGDFVFSPVRSSHNEANHEQSSCIVKLMLTVNNQEQQSRF